MPEPLLATEADPKTEVQTGKEGADDLSLADPTEQKPQIVDPSTETPEKPEGAPETYEFKNPEGLPEDVKVDAKIHDAYAEAARELDLPQDKAQGLFSKTMTALHARAIEEQSRQTAQWRETAEADPELRGGEGFEANKAIALKARDEFGSEGLRELLNDPNGLGNHPEIVRWMFRVGKAISEDRFVGSDKVTAVDLNDEAAMAAKLYDKS